MQDTELTGARLRDAATVPELLAAGFDAFEVIRRAAREGVDAAVPGLFAAFMKAACEAVEGREAITAAPSLPPGPATLPAGPLTAEAGTGQVMTALADLAELLAARLSWAATAASLEGDRAACGQAAGSAQRIRRLMGRDDGATGLR